MFPAEEILGERIVKIRALSGGSIHETSRIETESGRTYVLKESAPGEYFEAEADGLGELGKAGAIRVPEVRTVSKEFLIMEWIEPAAKGPGFFAGFGRALARMHRVTGTRFGHARNNFIGSLPQDNAWSESLSEFFAERRFRALVAIGRDRRMLDRALCIAVENVCRKLSELLAPIEEPPALLHGDLWGGNYLSSFDGPVLIDPAVYYGPREADIAMTRLFGGFDGSFYTAYEEEYPLAPGWRDRVDLFNLYHLLTHAIMFGGGYAGQALAAAKKYG